MLTAILWTVLLAQFAAWCAVAVLVWRSLPTHVHEDIIRQAGRDWVRSDAGQLW